MNNRKIEWTLLESPDNFDEFLQILPDFAAITSGLLLRFGAGISPIAFSEKIRENSMNPGFFIQLRDTNELALFSILRTAVAQKVNTIFVGDPAALKDVESVGKINAPAFVESACKRFRDSLHFGAMFRYFEKPDVVLIEKFIRSGINLLALSQKYPSFQGNSYSLISSPEINSDARPPYFVDLSQFEHSSKLSSRKLLEKLSVIADSVREIPK
ncbi:MAG: hypothetical protein HQM10_22380 [Candidatus Riflebacteria bacterium]|nr:hypothetical protein [Candidatus Riflebacteria bacterium]